MKELLDSQTAAVARLDGGLGALNTSNQYDLNFLAEVQAMHEIIAAVSIANELVLTLYKKI